QYTELVRGRGDAVGPGRRVEITHRGQRPARRPRVLRRLPPGLCAQVRAYDPVGPLAPKRPTDRDAAAGPAAPLVDLSPGGSTDAPQGRAPRGPAGPAVGGALPDQLQRGPARRAGGPPLQRGPAALRLPPRGRGFHRGRRPGSTVHLVVPGRGRGVGAPG